MHMNRILTLSVVLAVLGIANTVAAIELPDLKAGLWESRTSMGATKNSMSTMCMDNATYKKMSDDQEKNPNRPCKVLHSEHSGSTISSEVECKFGDKVSRSKTVMTLSGNTGYHSETRSSDNSVAMVIDSKYTGACPAGMKLGDVTGPQGMKFNVLDK